MQDPVHDLGAHTPAMDRCIDHNPVEPRAAAGLIDRKSVGTKDRGPIEAHLVAGGATGQEPFVVTYLFRGKEIVTVRIEQAQTG